MSFYYVLLRGWMHIFGDSEAAVRGLSVFFGVAVIPATYLIGKRLFGRKAAIASTALSTVNVFQIRYSQEARSYSLVMLLVLLSTYFFLRIIDSPIQKRYRVAYILVSVCAVYAHVFAYLVVLAQWLSLSYSRLFLIRRKTILWTAAGFILLTTPMSAFILLKDQGQLDWVQRPTVQIVRDFADFFTGNGGVMLIVAYALCLIAALWPVVSEVHRSPEFDERWRTNLVAWWLLFPIATTLLVSFLKPIFYERYMTICAPALVLLAGQGIAKLDQISLRLRGIYPAAVIMLLALSLWGFSRYENGSSLNGDEWRLVTRYVLERQQPGDSAFFYRASGSRPFEYYVHREIVQDGDTASPTVIFPTDINNPQYFNVEPDKQEAKRVIGDRKRIWLVLQHYEGNPAREVAVETIQAALQEGYRIFQEQIFPGTSGPIKVLLYVRAPGLNSSSTSSKLRS